MLRHSVILPTTPGAETVTAVSTHKPMKTLATEIGTTIIMHYRLATQKMYKNRTWGKGEMVSISDNRKKNTDNELSKSPNNSAVYWMRNTDTSSSNSIRLRCLCGELSYIVGEQALADCVVQRGDNNATCYHLIAVIRSEIENGRRRTSAARSRKAIAITKVFKLPK